MIERDNVRAMLQAASDVLGYDDLFALWRASLAVIGEGDLLPGDVARVTLALRRLSVVRPAVMRAGYFMQVERCD